MTTPTTSAAALAKRISGRSSIAQAAARSARKRRNMCAPGWPGFKSGRLMAVGCNININIYALLWSFSQTADCTEE
eukprot:scaffold31830_cov129-Isochrysis_galbana.AAC.2